MAWISGISWVTSLRCRVTTLVDVILDRVPQVSDAIRCRDDIRAVQL